MSSLTHARWHLGMPHTISGAMSEVALLAHCQDLQWKEMGRIAGCPASRFRDLAGNDVYASIYFVDVDFRSVGGLGAFRPDDELELIGRLGAYGASMLDGTHRVYAQGESSPELAETQDLESSRGASATLVAGAAPSSLAATAGDDPPAVPQVRLSFVLVGMARGPQELRISTPTNAQMNRIPRLASEPDSYRLSKQAQASGMALPTPATAVPLWTDGFTRSYAINPDRDLNGVGLLYFANYVAFLDAAERDALSGPGRLPSEDLAGRVTLRRRIGYYGNAEASDRLRIEVEAFDLDGPPTRRLLVHHRVRRESDGRLIAVASAERRLRETRA